MRIDSTGGVNFASSAAISGSLDLTQVMSVSVGATVDVLQDVTLRSTSILTNSGVVQFGGNLIEEGGATVDNTPVPR